MVTLLRLHCLAFLEVLVLALRSSAVYVAFELDFEIAAKEASEELVLARRVSVAVWALAPLDLVLVEVVE